MSRAPALCRDRAAVVMVGDVGMPPRRTPYYEREISLLFARSYGPGRYEPSYEAWGVDYPAGQVRWTEGRNQEAVLDLLAAGRLRVSDLITQSFGIDRADEAFRLLEERTEPCLAIRLTYPAAAGPDQPVRLKPRPADRVRPGVGWIGAGAFSTGTLLPAFRDAGFERFVAVATASGVSARRAAERHGFEKAVSGADAVIDDPDVSVVVIATPHDVHDRTRQPGPGRRAGRVVRKAAGADLRRPRRGGEGLAGIGAPAHARLQPALGPGRAGRAAGTGGGAGAEAGGLPDRRGPGA